MTDEYDFTALAEQHKLGDESVPGIVVKIAGADPLELVWHNELGGLTFKFSDRFVKWNPRDTGIDLTRERVRLDWLEGRHRAPRVVEFGEDADAQWMITEALPGGFAVGDVWRARRSEAITAIADGLRAIHQIPVDDFPQEWTAEVWVGKAPANLGVRPLITESVLVHGDACAPNTLISTDGRWTGNVDFGDLAVGDRWADLAIASLSLDWNFGKGHQPEFFDAYGVDPDVDRIDYYRALWHQES